MHARCGIFQELRVKSFETYFNGCHFHRRFSDSSYLAHIFCRYLLEGISKEATPAKFEDDSITLEQTNVYAYLFKLVEFKKNDQEAYETKVQSLSCIFSSSRIEELVLF